MDIVLLNADPIKVPVEEIKDSQVEMTVLPKFAHLTTSVKPSLIQHQVNLTLDFGARPFRTHETTVQTCLCLPVPESRQTGRSHGRQAGVTADRFSVNTVEDPAQCGEPLNP